MTNEEIFIKAYNKAVRNGWKPPDIVNSKIMKRFPSVVFANYKEVILFNKDFAKALWGKDIRIVGETPGAMTDEERPLAWQWHLQQMVIAKDLIAYLERHLVEHS